MIKVSLEFVLNSVHGKLLCGNKDSLINDVATDSRAISPGTLFFALKGDNFDGHDFVTDALHQGASAAVIEKMIDINKCPANCGIILVNDTLEALQRLAGSYRALFNLPVVAVTGSVGKTTTKDLLAFCLKSRFNTLKTPGNFNNDIGLPLTIFKLNPHHQAVVVEMAMRGSGEISRLASIARPTCAIITNIEPVHLETMGTLSNICQAKCEILAALHDSDFALINGDNELLTKTAENFGCRKYTFGYSPDCDIQIIDREILSNGININLRVFAMKKSIFFPIPAPQLATNVASAAGMAFLLGVNWEDIKISLSEYKTSSNRLNIIKLKEGGAVINDTYNANPVSMMAALEVSKTLACRGRTVAVLGDMLELGNYEVSGHWEVGKRAAELGVDLLIAVGERSRDIARGAIEAGMEPESVRYFNNKQDSLMWLKKNICKEDIVLFKASRGMQLETLLDEWMA